MPKIKHFKSMAGYRKYQAFKHIHLKRKPERLAGRNYVVIAGHLHKIHHARRRR